MRLELQEAHQSLGPALQVSSFALIGLNCNTSDTANRHGHSMADWLSSHVVLQPCRLGIRACNWMRWTMGYGAPMDLTCDEA